MQKLSCNFGRLGIGVACVCYFATSLLCNSRLVAQLMCKLEPRQHAKTKRRTLFRMCIAGSCTNSSYDSHTAQWSTSWSSTVKFVWNCRSECNITHTGYDRAHTEPHSEVIFETVVRKTRLTISTSCLRLAPSCWRTTCLIKIHCPMFHLDLKYFLIHVVLCANNVINCSRFLFIC